MYPRSMIPLIATSLLHQDIDGNTALHAAVIAHRNEAVTILLDAGADPTRYNNDFFSPILEASKNGFYAYVFIFIYLFLFYLFYFIIIIFFHWVSICHVEKRG